MKRKIIAILIVVLILCTAELAARNALARSITRPDNLPPEYMQSVYFRPDFQVERRSADQRIFNDNGYWTHRNATGQYINIRDGIRITTGQPVQYKATVWLFGSSSVVGFEMADKDTLASQLQMLMPDYRVVNMGMQASISIHQWSRLQDTTLSAGDIVVFYVGIMEAESVWSAMYKRQQDALVNHPCVWAYKQAVALFKLLCGWTEVISDDTRNEYMQGDIEYMISRHSEAVNNAKQYAESAGAKFYLFLQPLLWTKELSANERVLESRYPADIIPVIRATWPHLQSIDEFDLTHLLDTPRKQGSELYLDTYHVNEYGNAVIARAIYDALLDSKVRRC